MKCKCCERELDLRLGACFDCANFEALIDDKKDMNDKPIERVIKGSDSLNILRAIIKNYIKD